MLKLFEKKRLLSLIIVLVFLITSSLPAAFGAGGATGATAWAATGAVGEAPDDEEADGAATVGGAEDGEDGEDAEGAEGAEGAEEAPPPDYSDLSASYADLTQDEKAQILNRLGVLLGDPDRGLMLEIMVRRSDAAVLFTRLLGREQYVKDRMETEFATSRFPDAPEGMWYTPYIAFCTSIGIIVGRDDGYFYPDDNISEKEFANVLLKILGYEYGADYFWDTVYEFSYDIGLFEDPEYATRTVDNREYYRRDVCDQLFAVLGLEKKNSPKLLIEELIETGAISERVAADLGFDLSGLTSPGTYDAGGEPVDADIFGIYHLEPDLIWVVFTKAVTFRDDSIEICQTYDYSKSLAVRVEGKTPRDLLLRTGEQIPGMDYTLEIYNVIEADGTNAGYLDMDLVGYIPGAAKDTPGGLTSLVRDANNLPGPSQAAAQSPPAGQDDGGVIDASGGSSGQTAADANTTQQPDGVATTPQQDGGTTSDTPATPTTTAPVPPTQTGNADREADYFRIINAYTTASNELIVYYSHPVSEAALNASYYYINQGSTILCSGSAGQIGAELVEYSTSSVKLTVSGLTFVRDTQYSVTVSGQLISSYTARLNDGSQDSFTFTADNVAVRVDNFTLDNIVTPTQYSLEVEFSQAINNEVAMQAFNYQVMDHNGKKIDVSNVTIITDTGSAIGAGSTTAAKKVRINLAQPLLTRQNCTLTVIYIQNSTQTSIIANQVYQFQYSGQGETVQKSAIALTGAISNDASSVILYFSQKLDPVSAAILSNYSVNGVFEGANQTITPVKATYDADLTPFMVQLYFASNRQFVKDRAYSVRISASIRDEKRHSPDRAPEMQFFASNQEPVNPVLKDAVIVGDGIVRLDFSKQILFDPARISEGNFRLLDSAGGAGAAQITPILVKYIDPVTVILRFDSLDMSRKYSVHFVSISDISGQYTTRYPELGSSVAVRAGKR